MIEQKLYVSSSPHIQDSVSSSRLMWMVCLALMPSTLWSFYLFGLAALSVIVATVLSSAIFEALSQYLMKKDFSIRDGSGILSGLILGLTLPPGLDIWICAVGAFIAMVVAKAFFGGLGQNIFNPAMTGRVFLLIAFPKQLTQWMVPRGVGEELCGLPCTALDAAGKVVDMGSDKVDIITAASPLGVLTSDYGADAFTMAYGEEVFTKLAEFKDLALDLALGTINGSIGETSVVFLTLGGIFLLATRVITWHIPVSCLATIAVFGGLFGLPEMGLEGAAFHLFTGAAVMGAFFIATDYVTSPLYPKGKLIFGAGVGVLTMVIRLWAGYPEGVSFAVLLMNAAVPLIDRYTKPKKFGFNRLAEEGGH